MTAFTLEPSYEALDKAGMIAINEKAQRRQDVTGDRAIIVQRHSPVSVISLGAAQTL